jgi:hypothetical protein
MNIQWVSTAASLPPDGEPIQLLLNDRDVPMNGVCANGAFHTRWAEYGVDRVRYWREAWSGVSDSI